MHLIKHKSYKLSNLRLILLPGNCAKIYVSLWSSIKWKIASCNHNLEHETHLYFKTTEQGKVFAKNIIIKCINIFVGKVHIELHAYFNYACGRWGKIVIMNHKWNMPTYHYIIISYRFLWRINLIRVAIFSNYSISTFRW